MYEVSSEIYKETNFQPMKNVAADGRVVSKFKFRYPNEEKAATPTITDKDGDLVVCRKSSSIEQKHAVIEIEHSEATVLKLVGLQVWRGALLLADFFIHKRHELQGKQVLELGAGVGLTSITAAIYARRVICSDVDMGGILNLIRANVQRNRKLCRSCEVEVLQFDFKQPAKEYSNELREAMLESDVIVAADVIYDDELTDAFIQVLDGIFSCEKENDKKKVVYVALEKRFVFTLSDLDSVAPMFEYFLRQTARKAWSFKYEPLDFPQYFEYERCKQLILLKLTSS